MANDPDYTRNGNYIETDWIIRGRMSGMWQNISQNVVIFGLLPVPQQWNGHLTMRPAWTHLGTVVDMRSARSNIRSQLQHPQGHRWIDFIVLQPGETLRGKPDVG